MKSHSCIAIEFKHLQATATECGFQDVVESSCVDPVGSSNHNNFSNLYEWEKMWNNRHVLCFAHTTRIARNSRAVPLLLQALLLLLPVLQPLALRSTPSSRPSTKVFSQSKGVIICLSLPLRPTPSTKVSFQSRRAVARAVRFQS